MGGIFSLRSELYQLKLYDNTVVFQCRNTRWLLNFSHNSLQIVYLKLCCN